MALIPFPSLNIEFSFFFIIKCGRLKVKTSRVGGGTYVMRHEINNDKKEKKT